LEREVADFHFIADASDIANHLVAVPLPVDSVVARECSNAVVDRRVEIHADVAQELVHVLRRHVHEMKRRLVGGQRNRDTVQPLLLISQQHVYDFCDDFVLLSERQKRSLKYDFVHSFVGVQESPRAVGNLPANRLNRLCRRASLQLLLREEPVCVGNLNLQESHDASEREAQHQNRDYRHSQDLRNLA
jgi:hypothetical protein